MNQLDQAAAAGGIELQPFERGRHSLLAASLAVAPGAHVVLELFDKQGPLGEPAAFGPEDHRLVAAAADFGTEMLRQALAERQMQRVLFDAVAAALDASDSLAESLARHRRPASGTAAARRGPGSSARGSGRHRSPVAPEATVRLLEAVRVLALRHGTAAVEHCTRLVESCILLDKLTEGTV